MRKLAGRWSSRSVQSQTRRLASAAKPVMVEMLESRTLLTTVVVNTVLDGPLLPTSGLVSIQDAVAIADTNMRSSTVIEFDPTVFAGAMQTIVIGAPLILGNANEAIKPIYIQAPPVGLTIASPPPPAAPVVVFEILNGANVTISNITTTQENPANIVNDIIVGGNGTTNGNITTGNGTVSTAKLALINCTAEVAGDGGVLNYGSVSFQNSTLIDNGSATSPFYGGGIANYGNASFLDSTVADNEADVIGNGEGGGIYNFGNLTMTNSTVADNDAPAGGGIYNDDLEILTNGVETSNEQGNATLINCTISENISDGLVNVAPTKAFKIGNTIVAGDTAGVGNDVYGGFSSMGNNLIGNDYGSTGWNTTDYLGTENNLLAADLNPLGLSPVGDIGPTLTMPPLIGSPAIDHGSNALVGTTTDQRGLPRISNGAANSGGNGIVDIGSCEYVPYGNMTLVTAIPPTSQTALVGQNPSAYFNLGNFTEQNAPGPFSVDVNWGDGTANTIFSVPSPGIIPAQPHVYANVGNYTVSFTVADSSLVYPCDTSKTVTFAVAVTLPTPTASIAGNVYVDNDDTGVYDANNDPGMQGVLLYLDLDNTGKLAEGDPTCISDENGNFAFTGLLAGTYHVREEVPGGNTATAPLAGYDVTLTNGQAVANEIFMNAPATGSTEQPVYRLYCAYTKEHLFTADLNEYTTLGTRGGWIQEGLAYYDYNGPITIEGVTDEPLYRLYNTASKQHLWTTDINEYNTLPVTQGWNQEGIAGYVFPTAVAGAAPDPLYRLSYASPALHLWTTDLNEYDTLAAQSTPWTQEGIACYVL